MVLELAAETLALKGPDKGREVLPTRLHTRPVAVEVHVEVPQREHWLTPLTLHGGPVLEIQVDEHGGGMSRQEENTVLKGTALFSRDVLDLLAQEGLKVVLDILLAGAVGVLPYLPDTRRGVSIDLLIEPGEKFLDG